MFLAMVENILLLVNLRCLNWGIGEDSQGLNREMPFCLKCKTTFTFVQWHNTQYNKLEAVYPLCKRCWEELTPEGRLPYYRNQFEERRWQYEEDWLQIQTAVLGGE